MADVKVFLSDFLICSETSGNNIISNEDKIILKPIQL
jgi:hypothetical protein